MKKGFYRSLIGGALVSAMLASAFLSSCQPTPEKPIVNAGDDTVLNDKIKATPVPTPEQPDTYLSSIYGFPSEYKDEFKCVDTDVNVKVNMKINVPDVQKVPVVETVPSFITAEQIKNLTETVNPGITFYDMKDVLTKEDAQSKIEEYQDWINQLNAQLGRPGADTDAIINTRNHCESYIEEYKKLLPTLPESYEKKPTDFTFHELVGYYDYLTPEHKAAIYGSGLTEDYFNTGRDYMMLTATLENGWDVYINVKNQSDESPMGDYMESCFEYQIDDIPGSELTGSKLDREGIAALGEKVIEGLGLSGVMTLSSMAKDADSATIWDLVYRRTFGGVEIGNVDIENEYASVVGNETLEVWIQNDTITGIDYKNPYTISNMENENVELISFEEAYSAFKKQAALEFTKGSLNNVTEIVDGVEVPVDEAIESVNVVINYARLVLVRTPIKNGGYRYVPAWQFYGSKHFAQDPNSEYYNPDANADNFLFMTINAVDGTRIAGL